MELRSSKKLKTITAYQQNSPSKVRNSQIKREQPNKKDKSNQNTQVNEPVKSHPQIIRQLELQKRKYQKWIHVIFLIVIALVTIIGFLFLSKYF